MFVVDKEKCTGCGLCVKDCFLQDIELMNGKAEIKNKNCFKCGHCIAICPAKAVSTDEYNMKEVIEYDENKFKIQPELLLNFIKYRRSIRHFKNIKVEKEKIIQIIEAGRFSPTGGNTQDVSYIVVEEKIEELRKLALESLKKLGEKILQSKNRDLETQRYKRYARIWIYMYNEYLNNPDKKDGLLLGAPVVIFSISNNITDAALSGASMEFMTNSLNLGAVYSGFLTWAVNESIELKEMLGMKEDQSVAITLVLGYPDIKYYRTVPRKERRIEWK